MVKYDQAGLLSLLTDTVMALCQNRLGPYNHMTIAGHLTVVVDNQEPLMLMINKDLNHDTCNPSHSRSGRKRGMEASSSDEEEERGRDEKRNRSKRGDRSRSASVNSQVSIRSSSSNKSGKRVCGEISLLQMMATVNEKNKKKATENKSCMPLVNNRRSTSADAASTKEGAGGAHKAVMHKGPVPANQRPQGSKVIGPQKDMQPRMVAPQQGSQVIGPQKDRHPRMTAPQQGSKFIGPQKDRHPQMAAPQQRTPQKMQLVMRGPQHGSQSMGMPQNFTHPGMRVPPPVIGTPQNTQFGMRAPQHGSQRMGMPQNLQLGIRAPQQGAQSMVMQQNFAQLRMRVPQQGSQVTGMLQNLQLGNQTPQHSLPVKATQQNLQQEIGPRQSARWNGGNQTNMRYTLRPGYPDRQMVQSVRPPIISPQGVISIPARFSSLHSTSTSVVNIMDTSAQISRNTALPRPGPPQLQLAQNSQLTVHQSKAMGRTVIGPLSTQPTTYISDNGWTMEASSSVDNQNPATRPQHLDKQQFQWLVHQ